MHNHFSDSEMKNKLAGGIAAAYRHAAKEGYVVPIHRPLWRGCSILPSSLYTGRYATHQQLTSFFTHIFMGWPRVIGSTSFLRPIKGILGEWNSKPGFILVFFFIDFRLWTYECCFCLWIYFLSCLLSGAAYKLLNGRSRTL